MAVRDVSLDVLTAFVVAVHGPPEDGQSSAEGVHPLTTPARAFLEKHFGPDYARLPRAAYVPDSPGAAPAQISAPLDPTTGQPLVLSEEDILATLPADVRKKFLGRPEAERRFLTSADKKLHAPYVSMTLSERAFFLELTPRQREVHAAASPEERGFIQTLDPAMRALFLVLGSGFRGQLRERSSSELESLKRTLGEEVERASSKPVNELAKELSFELLGGASTPTLRRQTQKVLINLLSESPGNCQFARVAAFQSLLHTNAEFSDALLREVGVRVSEAQRDRAVAGADYATYFLRARPWLQSFALQLIHEDVTREALVQGLTDAVIAGACYAATRLPGRSSGHTSGNLKFVRPISV